jgi:hypothetical protein
LRAISAEMTEHAGELQRFAALSELAYDATESGSGGCLQSVVMFRGTSFECRSPHIKNEQSGHLAPYVISRTSSEQIIAIRGTSNIEDWKTDLTLDKVTDNILQVRVHSGFQAYALAIYYDIRDNQLLRADVPIRITGHSLGGAAALLVGLYLYTDYQDRQKPDRPILIDGVYTYAQPKVLDNEGATAWPIFSRRILRVAACDDIVTMLPTDESALRTVLGFDLFNGEAASAYQHVGQELYLMDDGKYWMPGGTDYERKLLALARDTILSVREKGHGLKASYLPRVSLATDPARGAAQYPIGNACKPPPTS